MRIKGLQRLTLIDYPEKVACTVFLAGCNFKCPWCYSPELVIEEKIKEQPDIKEEELFSFLKKRVGKLDGVVICGGEPTVSKDLSKLLRKIKEMGFLVKLDSNGSHPSAIEDLIKENLVDYIAMDVKMSPERYGKQEGLNSPPSKIKESIRIIKESGVDYEFRTTVVPGIHNKEEIIKIAKAIHPAKRYFLQNFLPTKTIDKSFLEKKPFTEEELQDFRKEAGHYVEQCQVR